MPHWELYSATGKKIHAWLRTNTEPANSLWRKNLLKIVQQSMSPHCPSCTCPRTQPLPARPLDLEDVRTLRVIKLNPILSKDDVLIRDSLNGLSLHPPPFVLQSMPLEVGPSHHIQSSYEEATHMSSSVQRTVRYRSLTSPVAQTPKYATAASQCSPPISKKDKKKKAKKQRRQKSMTPDSTCEPSMSCDRNYDP